MDKRSQRSEKTKLKIIHAAMECYKELGVQGSSLDLIAQQAQTTKPTIYSHFGSKENLYTEVVNYVISDIHTCKTVPKFNANIPIKTQLFDFISSELERVLECETRRLLVAITIESMQKGQCYLNQIESIDNPKINQWLQDAIEAGFLLPGDINEMAAQLWALANGRTFYPIFLGIVPNEKEYKEACLKASIDFFLLATAVR